MTTAWTKATAKTIVMKARRRAGDGWRILSPALREALVTREILAVIMSWVDDAAVERIVALTNESMRQAGIDTSDVHW